jgi:hypothetical protein
LRVRPVKEGSTAVRGVVVVVDRRPLERNLVRFILQENGFEVAAEAATPAEALRAVEQERPAVVVLHENAAWERGRPTIPQLRARLPEGRLLVIASAFGVVRMDLVRDADAVLEEGIGFKNLPLVVGRLAAGDVARGPAGRSKAREPAPAPPREKERWLDRFQGATAAAVIFLALVIARAAAPPGPQSVDARPAVALQAAVHSLQDLKAVSTDQPQDLIQQATVLAVDRAAAVDAGANVSDLDAEILAFVHGVLPTLPDDAAKALIWVFGDVPGISAAAPTPTPTPTPSATPPAGDESGSGPPPGPKEGPPPSPEIAAPLPPPAPSEEPAPTPTEEPVPSPTEEPPPGHTDHGPPSQTETPTPSETVTETPAPSPTDQPPPSPTDQPPPRQDPPPTDTPSATDTPSPSESVTDTPSPSESVTDTPSPTQTVTDTPSPTETDTGSPSPVTTTASSTTESSGSVGSGTDAGGVGVLLIPPGVGALAGLARRRTRRARRSTNR